MSGEAMLREGRLQHACKLCGCALKAPALELGPLPPCNAFLSSPGEVLAYPLSVAACETCGFVQLTELPPVSAIVPRVSWIAYNEPDAHLADVMKHVVPLATCDRGTAYGVGPFDAPLLDLFAREGFAVTGFDLRRDSHPESGTYPYLETIQEGLRPDALARMVANKGTADVVVCRFLLEHSREPVQSLIALKNLLAPHGLLLVEVPDSTKFLSRHDYSFLWEEHVCYFTEQTLASMAGRAGLEIVSFLHIEGLLEDLIVAVLRRGETVAIAPTPAGQAFAAFAKFRDAFFKVKEAHRKRADQIVADGGKIAVFGAGHQAIMFVNALGLMNTISLFVDDDPKKSGMFISGQTRPIAVSSAILDDPAISTCLLATSPRSAEKLRQKLARFLDRGGRLYSVFPGAGMPTLIEEVQ